MVYSSLENAVVWGEVRFRVKKGHGGKKLPDYRKYRRPGDLPFTPAVLSGSEGLKPFEFRRQLVECRLGADLVRTADTAAAVWKRTGKACRRHGTEEVFLLCRGFPGGDPFQCRPHVGSVGQKVTDYELCLPEGLIACPYKGFYSGRGYPGLADHACL